MRKISIVKKNEFEPILQLLNDDDRYIPDIHNASYKGHFQEIHRLINEDPEIIFRNTLSLQKTVYFLISRLSKQQAIQ